MQLIKSFTKPFPKTFIKYNTYLFTFIIELYRNYVLPFKPNSLSLNFSVKQGYYYPAKEEFNNIFINFGADANTVQVLKDNLSKYELHFTEYNTVFNLCYLFSDLIIQLLTPDKKISFYYVRNVSNNTVEIFRKESESNLEDPIGIKVYLGKPINETEYVNYHNLLSTLYVLDPKKVIIKINPENPRDDLAANALENGLKDAIGRDPIRYVFSSDTAFFVPKALNLKRLMRIDDSYSAKKENLPEIFIYTDNMYLDASRLQGLNITELRTLLPRYPSNISKSYKSKDTCAFGITDTLKDKGAYIFKIKDGTIKTGIDPNTGYPVITNCISNVEYLNSALKDIALGYQNESKIDITWQFLSDSVIDSIPEYKQFEDFTYSNSSIFDGIRKNSVLRYFINAYHLTSVDLAISLDHRYPMNFRETVDFLFTKGPLVWDLENNKFIFSRKPHANIRYLYYVNGNKHITIKSLEDCMKNLKDGNFNSFTPHITFLIDAYNFIQLLKEVKSLDDIRITDTYDYTFQNRLSLYSRATSARNINKLKKSWE